MIGALLRHDREPIVLPVLGGALVGLMILGQPALPIVLAGALGVGLLGLVQPSWLVAYMFLGILFDKAGLSTSKLGDFPITAAKLSVLGSIGVWAMHSLWAGVRPVRWHPVLTAMFLVVVTTGLTTMIGNSMQYGKFTLYGLAMMTVMVALVYTVLADRPVAPIFRFVGVVFALALALSLVRSRGNGEAARTTGTMGDPNEWATIILLLSPFLLGGLANDDARLARGLRLAILGMAPLAVLATESRAALLVGAMVVPACIYLVRRNRGEMLAVGIGAVVAAPLLLDLELAMARFSRLVARAMGDSLAADSSLDERAELLRQGLDLFQRNWLVGVGPGNFQYATGFISESGKFRPAHNTYLEFAAEQGVVGLTAVAGFMLTVAWSIWGGWTEARGGDERDRVLGCAVGLASTALMSATLGLVTFSMAYLVLGVTLAVVAQSGRPAGVAR